MKLSRSSKIIITLYALTVVYWIVVAFIREYSLAGDSAISTLKLLTQIPETVIPLTGGLLAIRNSRKLGGTKSVLGKGVFFLGLGLLAWGLGMVMWDYYIFFASISIPYPSFADVGYVLGLIFLVTGTISLYRAIGVNFALKKTKGKAVLLIVPLVIIAVSAYLLVNVARGGSLADFSESHLKLFFDLLYPLGDVVMLSMATLAYILSRNILGGKLRTPILILLSGFVFFYASDFLFSYTTTLGTYYNGHFVDFLFTTTMFVLGLSLSYINPSYLNSAALAPSEKPAVAGSGDIFNQIIIAIIQRQERVAGQIAWEEAKKVSSLTVDQAHASVAVTGDPKTAIDQLVKGYQALFGVTAADVSRNAARFLVAELPDDQVPSILK